MPTRINIYNKFIHEKFNDVSVSYPNSTTEIYTFKLDNVTVAIVTVIYTNDTKKDLSSVVKT